MEMLRVWENVGKRSSDGNTFKFNVVSYNVLAQCLLDEHSDLYTCSSSSSLDWTLRSQRLYDEIVALAPDIICLQEVQESHLASFYSKFEVIGFSGVFKCKTDRYDGCAIYYRKSMFDLKDRLHVEFFQPNSKILNRNNVGLMVKLEHRDRPGSTVVVATTHLLYNPKRADVRLAQMRLFLAEIERFAFYKTDTESGYLPIILTGDLNASPEAAVIQLLEKAVVTRSSFPEAARAFSKDWHCLGVTEKCQHLSVYLNRERGIETNYDDLKIYNSEYSKTDPQAVQDVPSEQYIEHFRSGIISHPFNLTSVYTKYKADGNAEATTFQGCWLTVDYIYFSQCSTLQLIDRLRLPTVQECLEGLGRIPNSVCGSDHFSVAAVFEFKPKND